MTQTADSKQEKPQMPNQFCHSTDLTISPEKGNTALKTQNAMGHVEFLGTMKSRREHCRALLELSRRQRQLIHDGDMTHLLEVLGQKQRILGRFDEINRNHPHLRTQWRQQREDLLPEIREECEHVMAETEAILAEILKEEKEGTESLIERRDETQRQLQAISQGSQVHHAYRDALAPTTHRRLDIGQ